MFVHSFICYQLGKEQRHFLIFQNDVNSTELHGVKFPPPLPLPSQRVIKDCRQFFLIVYLIL